MYIYICYLALVSYACAASIGGIESTTVKREVVPVLRFETDKKPDGSFRFMYEGGDKSFREETGVLENAGTDDETLEVSGSYRYIDADGHEIEVHYTAGKNGFVPVGTNILPEITALAKAAADLPNDTVEEEVQRRARSKVEAEDVKKVQTKVETLRKSDKIENSEKVKKSVDNKKVEMPVEKPVAVAKPVEKPVAKPFEKKEEKTKAPKVVQEENKVAEPVKAVKAEEGTKPVEEKKEEKPTSKDEKKDAPAEKK